MKVNIVDVTDFICPNCKGGMKIDIETDDCWIMKCFSCGRRYRIEKPEIVDKIEKRIWRVDVKRIIFLGLFVPLFGAVSAVVLYHASSDILRAIFSLILLFVGLGGTSFIIYYFDEEKQFYVREKESVLKNLLREVKNERK